MSTYETDLDAARIISLVGEAFRVRRESSRPVRVTYLDTFDWRLFQAGARLSIWHVRSDVHARLETAAAAHQCELPADFVADFAWNLPSGHLRQALAAMTEVRRLLELAELDMVEHRLSILNGDDKTVARVRIDEISSRRPDVRNEPRSDATPTVLCTVSALIGYSASRKVARCLETNPEFEPVERGLFEIALDNAGQIPGSYATKLQLVLSPDTLAPDAVKTVGIALLETMVANEGGVREKVDSEFLHDFRIAVRRTRSLLAQVKGAFPPTRLTGFRAEFGWLGDITGGPRDLDVHRLKMADHKRELPSSIGGHLDPVDEFLERRHRDAYRQLRAALESDRYRGLTSSWREFLEHASACAPPALDADRPILEVASERIWRAYRRVRRKRGDIGAAGSDEALHELRIECKKLRYLLEFFRSLYSPKSVGGLIKALKRLQDNLGDLNDLSVQQQALHDFALDMHAEGSDSVDTLLAIGRVIEHLAMRRRVERARFSKCYAKFDTPESRRAFRRQFRG